jgi:hypothetical protein
MERWKRLLVRLWGARAWRKRVLQNSQVQIIEREFESIIMKSFALVSTTRSCGVLLTDRMPKEGNPGTKLF